jgi:hypothetical protein
MTTLFAVLMALIGFLLIFGILRPILVLIHELGHSFYALKYTKEEVDIIIGDYTDESDCFKFQKNRLTIYIKNNPIYWLLGGCCICNDEEMDNNEYISYCLGGVAFEILFTSVLFFPCWLLNAPDSIQIFTGILFMIAIIDTLTNLYPREITKGNFLTIYTDGFLIWKTLKGIDYDRKAMQKFYGYYRNKDFYN